MVNIYFYKLKLKRRILPSRAGCEGSPDQMPSTREANQKVSC